MKKCPQGLKRVSEYRALVLVYWPADRPTTRRFQYFCRDETPSVADIGRKSATGDKTPLPCQLPYLPATKRLSLHSPGF